jgi:hypothetical protein
MPIIDSVMKMYTECVETVYFIRFLDFIISKKFNSVEFNFNNTRFKPLISGVIEHPHTGKKYYSLVQLYNDLTGKELKEGDPDVFHYFFVSKAYNLNRILCSVKEIDVLEFFDQKYRAFYMYRDLKLRILHYTGIRLGRDDAVINVQWNGMKHELQISSITCTPHFNPYKAYELLTAYESGNIKGLEYYNPQDKSYVAISP